MRKRKRQRGKKDARQRQRNRERAQTMGAREDMRSQPSQAAWGTSPGSMGRVKAESEEAKLASCPECGYSGGRHSGLCPRSS